MDVIVIGCGAAGVAALRRLHDAGLNVIGLEAADRIGGRICTVEFGEGAVDIGAAWCHGEKDNAVFELVSRLGLLSRPEPNTAYFITSNGELLPDNIGIDIMNAFGDHVDKADKKSGSILDCVKNAAKYIPYFQSNPHLSKAFIEHYERMNHLGGQDEPTHGKSLKGLEEKWPCEGEPMLNWKGKGFKMVLDVLLSKFPDPTKEIPVQIQLNKEVESIRWSSNKSQADASAPPLVHVTCTDNSLYAAKSVIVTASIGVLKERHTTLFNPPLPTNKVAVIETLQMAVLAKIYIEFEKPWWPKTPCSIAVLWTEETKGEFSDEEKWITEIFALDTVAHQPNLLLAWLYGREAEAMERASCAQLHAGVNKLLSQVIAKNFKVSQVKNIVRTQWASNPLARGAYAYRSVATEQNGGDGAILLSEPLYHGDYPVVCFAGEATSHHRHNAVHGAVESGYREADRLIQSFKTLPY